MTQLELAEHRVRDVRWGQRADWEDGILTLSQAELRDLASDIEGVEDVDL